jgi:hypothetical protein
MTKRPSAPRAAALVAAAAAALHAAPALATRGPDDVGLMVISSILVVLGAAFVSGVVYLPLYLWTASSGRRRGRYWLTLLGCLVGAGAGVLLLRNLPTSVVLDDGYETRYWLMAIPFAISAVVGVACFFIWRKPPLRR